MISQTVHATRRILAPLVLLSAIGVASIAQTTARPGIAPDAKSIETRIRDLRSVPDDQRGEATRQIALDIRKLTAPGVRVDLADGLANLATEGDFGHQTIEEVATTLAEALKREPAPSSAATPAEPYVALAQLVRYEHAAVTLPDPQFAAAMEKLKTDDAAREQADFTLPDLKGTPWTLKSLKGKVVLVNFWATWCPPCKKEIPDLDLIYKRFKDKGFVVLGITDEDRAKVDPFVAAHSMTYPILLDAGRKVNTIFRVSGIPRTLIYGRDGKLAAEAIDMRTQKQLLALLATAGLE